MIDPLNLAQLSRAKPLRALLPPGSATCALGGCPVDEHSYAAPLPDRAGLACTGCAVNAGFEIDWSRI